MKFLSGSVFLLSFIVGLLVMYIQQPETTKVYVYPTPENLSKFQWKDNIDNCYEWEKQKVNCANYKNINHIPIQN
tara:strand:+ start:251 stop:475 length:225 start_codon:yes stop_codon:yes gene_type:complete